MRKKEEEEKEATWKEMGDKCVCKTLEGIYTIWDKIQTSDKVGET